MIVPARIKVISFLVFFVLFSSNLLPQSQVTNYTVTPQELNNAPVSPLLYGNFIELGYGLQVEAMWGEMFFNRSFEKFVPYRDINKLWYDLFYDEKDLSKGYQRDWSVFDWYHSGYEHNSWFATPGQPVKGSYIDDTSTFIVKTSPVQKVVLVPEAGGSGHGTQCLEVINNEPGKWSALAQEGKYLRKGEQYIFRGEIKSNYGTDQAEIRFYPQGKWDKPIMTYRLKPIGNNFSEYSCTFHNDSYNGYATFSLWIPGKSAITVDNFSLMPANTYYGWRNEVVSVFKQLKPKIVRFPGGCFASFYNWKDGIGPYSQRKPQESYFWGGLNYNDVGTAEYAMLCKAAGAEMQLCVNVYHPSKRRYDVDFPDGQSALHKEFPQFMSLTEGARSAAEWVAYCNLPAGSHPMADLRASHGYPQPFGVKYWELDNEVHRWFEAEDYAWAVVVYSKAMKAIDPTIKIGMSSYGERPGKPEFHQEVDKMLDIAGPYIDFLADRADADTVSRYMIAKVRAYNKSHRTNIKYCDTEWLAYNTETNRNLYNMAERKGEVTKSYAFSKWSYALNLMKNFMSFQRMGPELDFVNFNNLANTHSQSAMETPKEGAYLTASGKVLQLLSNSPAAWILKIKDYNPHANDEYQVQAAWDQTKGKIILFICNRTSSDQKGNFDLTQLGKPFKIAKIEMLDAASPVSMNTLQHPDAIRTTNTTQKVSRGRLPFYAPPYSLTEIIVE